MQENLDKVSFIIVTWNSGDVIPDCINSIRKYLPQDGYEIILSDNNSSNPEYLDQYENQKDITVIRNPENYGYSKAVNIGFEATRNPITIILNPDIVFNNNPIPNLIKHLVDDPSIGVIGPMLYNEDGTPQIFHFYPTYPTLMQTLLLKTNLNRFAFVRKISLEKYHARIEDDKINFVPQIPGAFLLFRKSDYPDKKPLNEYYFIWYEDVEFCRNLSYKNKKTAVLPSEKVTHLGGTSFNKWNSVQKLTNFLTSFLKYLHRHHSTFEFYLHTAALFMDMVLITFVVVIRDIVLFRYKTMWPSLKLKLIGLKTILKMVYRLKFS